MIVSLLDYIYIFGEIKAYFSDILASVNAVEQWVVQNPQKSPLFCSTRVAEWQFETHYYPGTVLVSRKKVLGRLLEKVNSLQF